MTETLRLSFHIVRRNWAVYRKDFLANISPTVADPLFILLSLGMGLSPFIKEMDGLSYREFLGPGLMAASALFTSFFECSYGFYVRMSFENIFKAMLTTPIGVTEVVVGEFIWVFLKGAVMALGVFAVLALFGLIPNLAAVFVVPLIGGLIGVACGAMGLVASGYVHNINQFQTVYSFLISPLYFLSGVFFPIPAHPLFQKFIQISPFYHGVVLMQLSVWGRGSTEAYFYHLVCLLAFTLIFGAWAVKKIRGKLIG